ncbi:MAG: MBL fold metallo-hydrolase [Actinomycetota bacterium]|nr:MBL fold metallo-hydrolase [Actinomycetota bacterium]
MTLAVIRVLAPNPSIATLEGTNTWIVGDDPTIVIDPGPLIDEHLEEVARAAGRVAHVLMTHDHEDHAAGAVTFARLVGANLTAWRIPGTAKLHDGQGFTAGEVELIALHTPGHSADHVVFSDAGSGALFTGDAVLGRGTSLIDAPDGDLAKYLTSLRRMLEREPRTIYPGHGPVVLDAQAKLREYLEHRAEREEQIIAGLAAGDRTVDALVERIYAEHPLDVQELASRSVTAHLLKLETEGRVAKAGRVADRTWTIVEPKACARCGRPVKGRARYCGSCSLALLQGDSAGSA